MSSNSNWIKAYIVDVLPCMTIALYILAFVYNLAFYSVFNINITHYLSLGDMLLSILESLVLLGVLSLFFIWAILYLSTFNLSLIEQEKRRRENMPFRTKRRIVKFRNMAVVRWFVFIMGKKKKKEKSHDKSEVIEEKKDQNPWKIFFFALLIVVMCLYIYFDSSATSNEHKGLMKATIWLLLPFLFLFGIATADICLTMTNISDSKTPAFVRKYKPAEVVEVIVIYFIYALIIFYSSGLECGKYTKNNDVAKFELLSTDGTLFSDSTYRYIDIVNDKVFLLEKETGNKVILNNQGIVYLKINYNDDINNSIVNTFIKNEMWKKKEDNN